MTSTPDSFTSVTLDAEGSAREQLDKLASIDFGNDIRYPEDVAAGSTRNAYRASRLIETLRTYAAGGNELGEPMEQIVRDLLSDLMHFTDLLRDEDGDGFEFNDLVARAGDRYLEEFDGE